MMTTKKVVRKLTENLGPRGCRSGEGGSFQAFAGTVRTRAPSITGRAHCGLPVITLRRRPFRFSLSQLVSWRLMPEIDSFFVEKVSVTISTKRIVVFTLRIGELQTFKDYNTVVFITF